VRSTPHPLPHEWEQVPANGPSHPAEGIRPWSAPCTALCEPQEWRKGDRRGWAQITYRWIL